MQDTSGVHAWLVLGKAFQALAARLGNMRPLWKRPPGSCQKRSAWSCCDF